MKKIALGLIAALIIVSLCKCNCSNSLTKNKTLNDIDEVTAVKMIQHFEDLKDNDKSPVTESFWISKEAIHDIVALLHSEIAEEKEKRDPLVKDPLYGLADGIRIYFATNLSGNTYPLDNTIILVSTKDNGKADASAVGCKSGRRHLDYYEHQSNADLFNLSNHEFQCVSEGCPGDSLYSPAKETIENKCNIPHGISKVEAKTMVQYFLTPHIINTTGEWFDLCLFETLDKSSKLNGIRIYFAKHNKVMGDSSKSMRDAFVITTTMRNPKTGTTDDYFDCEDINNISNLYMKAYYDKYPLSKNYQIKHTMISPPQDNGELCPFNCN